MGSSLSKHKEQRRITLLSGGVGGARLARGLAVTCEQLTVIVNVGDDERIYGLHVAADIDTVTNTLAGIEGPAGWGVRDDTFTVMDALAAAGIDTTFRLGDRDLAACMARTLALDGGAALSDVTTATAKRLGISASILPATDDELRTKVKTADGEWLSFQEYFVMRRHQDEVAAIRFEGTPLPAPGVLEAIAEADLVVVGPSNPVLSIWPILAVPGIREAVARHDVVAVSPLIGGEAVKGPAASVLRSLGYPSGSAGVAAAYGDLVTTLVVDASDASDRIDGVEIKATDTRIATLEASVRLANFL
ncbi:MAG: 2-phospho-L-lactate transferase [Acidimicrobiia bacterium]|nr:2-phospho-L-lactate transferase [Acidimicrobiia bacterium]